MARIRRCPHDGKHRYYRLGTLGCRSLIANRKEVVYDLTPTERLSGMPRKGQSMPPEQRAKISAARMFKSVPEQKRCPQCRLVKPADAFDIRRGSSNVSGFVLNSLCIICHRESRRRTTSNRTPRTPRTRVPAKVRFEAKVSKPTNTDCWLWTGCINAGGYGKFGAVKGQSAVYVHRWAYEQAVGPVPSGYHVDHLCRVRNCVNPAHLEAVTPAENVRRSHRWPRRLLDVTQLDQAEYDRRRGQWLVSA